MTDVEAIERAMEKARARIGAPTQNGGGKAEGEYGALYQRLVQLGVRPQLRGKYRRA